MENYTILIVDDEVEIRDLLTIYLKNEGMNVLTAAGSIEALRMIEKAEIHVAVLDIMLPDLDGIKLCKRIREQYDFPILMLSAKGESTDKILGIMEGADDYVSKPFHPLEVVVRIKALLKRSKVTPSTKETIVVEDIEIHLPSHQVLLDGEDIRLTQKEFEILRLLAENRGNVFSNSRIYEAVWQDPFFESDQTIMTHIKNMREKLREKEKSRKIIQTVWGVGYKIEK